jgi:hypothetical protein
MYFWFFLLCALCVLCGYLLSFGIELSLVRLTEP